MFDSSFQLKQSQAQWLAKIAELLSFLKLKRAVSICPSTLNPMLRKLFFLSWRTNYHPLHLCFSPWHFLFFSCLQRAADDSILFVLTSACLQKLEAPDGRGVAASAALIHYSLSPFSGEICAFKIYGQDAPFEAVVLNRTSGEGVLRASSPVDCESQKEYTFIIQAYDCGAGPSGADWKKSHKWVNPAI